MFFESFFEAREKDVAITWYIPLIIIHNFNFVRL